MPKHAAKKAKPAQLPKKHVLRLVVLGFIIIVGGSLFFTRARIDKVYYDYRVHSALSSATKKLNNPLQAVGFKNIKHSSRCGYEMIAGYSGWKLGCGVQDQSYQVLPSDTASKQAIMRNAFSLNTLLEKNGWNIETTSITPWFQNVIDGIDYQPDDFNYIETGNMFCVLDFQEAFSKPKPPAISVTFSCDAPTPKSLGG